MSGTRLVQSHARLRRLSRVVDNAPLRAPCLLGLQLAVEFMCVNHVEATMLRPTYFFPIIYIIGDRPTLIHIRHTEALGVIRKHDVDYAGS